MHRDASFFSHENSGVSLVEVIITLGVIGFITVASLGGISAMRSRAGLQDAHAGVLRALEGARNRAATGVGGTNHGVHIEAGVLTVFTGSSYIPGLGTDTPLPPSVSISPPQATVIFSRLSARADQPLVLTISASQNDSRTIAVTEEGMIIPEQ